MVSGRWLGNIPVPFPDENCYSLLCRYAVRRGDLTSSQVSEELFGHTQPLAGYLFKPFRLKDIEQWFGMDGISDGLRYGADHSCYPYYAAFLSPAHAGKINESRIGSAMTTGQAKRINRECGFSRGHKKRLWYCPECVREDFSIRGETCWRRLPQMPGAVYCPVHKVKFRESGVGYRDINYQIIPATYALIHLEEPDAEAGNVYEERYLRLAQDIAWLLDNGYSLRNNDWVRQTYATVSGNHIRTYLYSSAVSGGSGRARFEDYLAGKILSDCGKNRIDISVGMHLGMILSIEEAFGSMKNFSEL